MGRGPHTILMRAVLRHAGVGSPCGRDPRGSMSSRIPPPPRRGPFWGGGGVPSAPGGRRAAPVAPKLGGGVRGGGWGGRPPAPPPCPASACLPSSPACPPGVYSHRGACRAAAGVRRGPVGRRRVSAAGGGGGGGDPPALVRAPVFPGPASDEAAPFAPSWALPVCRRPAAGRACGRLPRPWCPLPRVQRPLRGGCGAAVSSVCLRPLLGLSGRGGGRGGGPLVPWCRLLTAGGGGRMAVPAPGASHRLRGRTLPPPPST